MLTGILMVAIGLGLISAAVCLTIYYRKNPLYYMKPNTIQRSMVNQFRYTVNGPNERRTVASGFANANSRVSSRPVTTTELPKVAETTVMRKTETLEKVAKEERRPKVLNTENNETAPELVRLRNHAKKADS